ncbi:helicase RepA family protein, partial [Paracoccaceae bacterium]|nr:helicase RepA family protein [Paracoccaceae bacterium]
MGKSYFILKLIKDIICNGGKAFYMAGEDSNWLLQSRLKQLSLGGRDFINHRGREAELAKPENYLRVIEDILSTYRCDAVFLDNMQMVLPAKLVRKDDYEYHYDHLPHWARLAEKYKCAIVMVHHARKDNGQVHPNPLQSILGSTAITGACDTI